MKRTQKINWFIVATAIMLCPAVPAFMGLMPQLWFGCTTLMGMVLMLIVVGCDIAASSTKKGITLPTTPDKSE